MAESQGKTEQMQPWLALRLTKARVSLALAGFVAINLAVLTWLGPANAPLRASSFSDSNCTSPMYGTWTWWMARGFVQNSLNGAPDIALMGSSQVNSPSWAADARWLHKSVDCLEHRKIVYLGEALKNLSPLAKPCTVVNCAVQGGMASDYYMIERTLFQDNHRPKLTIICLSPRDFIDNKLPSASSTEPFRFFARFMDAGKLTELAYPNLQERLFARLDTALSRMPVRRLSDFGLAGIKQISSQISSLSENSHSSSQAAKVAAAANVDEVAAQPTVFSNGSSMAVLGPLPAKQNAPHTTIALAKAISNRQLQVKLGEWVVPPDMQNIFVDNSVEYKIRYSNPNPPSYAIQQSFFRELLSDLQKRGCSVLVVEMPTLPSNRALLPQKFWSDYQQSLSSACEKTGASLVDFSADADFQKSDYVDTVHLNDFGGLKFFSKLAKAVVADKRLAQSLTAQPGLASRDPGAQASRLLPNPGAQASRLLPKQEVY